MQAGAATATAPRRGLRPLPRLLGPHADPRHTRLRRGDREGVHRPPHPAGGQAVARTQRAERRSHRCPARILKCDQLQQVLPSTHRQEPADLPPGDPRLPGLSPARRRDLSSERHLSTVCRSLRKIRPNSSLPRTLRVLATELVAEIRGLKAACPAPTRSGAQRPRPAGPMHDRQSQWSVVVRCGGVRGRGPTAAAAPPARG